MTELAINEDSGSINLSFRSLSSIPDKLWEFQHIHKLVLAGNPLTSIPQHLSKLTNLQTLNCGSCELTSFPTPAVPYLQSLTYLNLSGNQITEVPENLGKLVGLTEVLLGTNCISRLPNSFGDLENLTILKLGKCKFEEFPPCIGRLKQLKELQLSENSITGPIPSYIYQLPNLESLDLGYNKIDALLGEDLMTCSGSELDAFFCLPMAKLRVLTLNDNFLQTIPPHTISNFTSLQVLQLSFNKLTSLPDDIALMQSLVMIDISSNSISELHPEWGQLMNLSSLDVSYNDLATIPDTFTNLQSLRVFTVLGNNMQEIPPICQTLADRGVRVRFNDASSIPNSIIPGLFLGGVSAARDKYTLKRLGIKRVLTVAEIDPLHAGEFVYKVVRVDDHADQDLSAFFEECRQFISGGIQDGGVLVHCAAGVSRSATMVIMYVMAVRHLSILKRACDVAKLTNVRCLHNVPTISFVEPYIVFSKPRAYVFIIYLFILL
eukprot:Phypoly_transcript_07214.p1 GENE.Phypoly_transcript_07214~~Phypoly_transcript_07214.p1  ORF type:complete len:492 (+),score=47.51 Phypoly_transcript_07214:58-1533(+)